MKYSHRTWFKMSDTLGYWRVSCGFLAHLDPPGLSWSCFCFHDLCPLPSIWHDNPDEELRFPLPALSVWHREVSSFHFFLSLHWAPRPHLSLPHFFISLSSFVVLHPMLGFQMHSLPLLILCYFPQSSCNASLSQSYFLAHHPSRWSIGMLNLAH